METNDIKVAIVGCGAIGASILAFLSRAGRSVTGIDTWDAHVYRSAGHGLEVEAVDETFVAHPTIVFPDAIRAGEKFDVVVLAVKGYETRMAALYARDLLSEDGFLVSSQNGLHERDLPVVIGEGRVVGCVVAMSAELVGPGEVKCTTGAERTSMIFGEISGSRTDRTDILHELFGPLGKIEITSDIWSEIWGKFTLNVMSNAAGGISGYTTRQLWTDDESAELIIALGVECARVAYALDQRFSPVLKSLPQDLFLGASAMSSAEWKELTALLHAQGELRKGARENAPSLLQDIRKGRRTEVAYLNGMVADLGRSLGIPMPVNDAIIELVHRLEHHEIERDPKLISEMANVARDAFGG